MCIRDSHRLGSTDLASLGGLAQPLPLLTGCFLLLGMASIGLPGTNGFVAELLILLGLLQVSPGLAGVAVLGVIMGAAYFLSFFRHAFLGPVSDKTVASAADLRPRELLVACVLGVLAVSYTHLDVYKRQVIIFLRKKTPKEKAFTCARCKSIASFDKRTIQAWNAGFDKLYCIACHKQWLEAHSQQQVIRSRQSTSGCLGIFVLLLLLPILMPVSYTHLDVYKRQL